LEEYLPAAKLFCRQNSEDKKMRNIKYNFLFVIGLVLTLGLTTAFAGGKDDKVKRPKNTGILTVKTTPGAYPVRIDGQVVGMSGVSTPAEFYLSPGMHRVEIEGPNGQMFSKEIEIRRDAKNCICIKVIEETTKRPCPYDIYLSGPDRVIEGDLITFASNNRVTSGAVPVIYTWAVSPSNVNITSGLQTSSITVDTTGMAGQTITADLDVNDGVYDAACRQRISVPTIVDRKPELPTNYKFDEFDSLAFDDDKARLDAFAIELQNKPDSQGYIILYQGTDKVSKRSRNADTIGKRTLDYLVKVRGVDPRRIVITNWGTRPKTRYELWIIPPGAMPPVPQ
jgi:hypothetical protein